MSIVKYYSNIANYKVIYNKKYEVKVFKPEIGTVIHNIFTGLFDKTSTYKPYVVVGPLGDEKVVSAQTLVSDYEAADGTVISALNEANESKGVVLTYKNVNTKYYVAMVPYRITNVQIGKMVCNRTMIPLTGKEFICREFMEALKQPSKRDYFLKTYSGNLIPVEKLTNVNLPQGTVFGYEVPHSTGDFIVCEATPDGSEADLHTAVCMNGSLFEQCFDMRYVSSISINLFSVLLEVELKKRSVQGYKLMPSYNAGPLGKMQYEFVSDNNMANEHGLLFRIGTNNKEGRFAVTLNKSSKDIMAVVESMGQKISLSSYLNYKMKYIEYCKQKEVKQVNELELVGTYIEKIVTDCCNFIYGAELKISKESEKVANVVINEANKMFSILGQGKIRDKKVEDKQGYKVFTVIYQHDLYGFESKSCIRFKMDNYMADAYIYDKNTKKAVLLVKQTRIQNEGTIKEFINAYKANLIQVVSGAAF